MKTALFWILIILSVGSLYVNCSGERKGGDDNSATALVTGNWKLDSSVCGTSVYSYSMIETKLALNSNGTYEVSDDLSSGCQIRRTGTWSAGGDSLSVSYSAVACNPANCTGTIKNNGNPENFGCSDVSPDGQNYLVSADKSTLYLTPTLGSDTGCYYKYIRQ